MINTLMLVSKKKGWIEATKIQQRGAALLLCVALIVSALAGCGGKDGPAEQRPAAGTVEYTNLNDSASRQLLERLLSDAGVSEERMEDFFSHVDRFNDSVSAEWLTQGFETAGIRRQSTTRMRCRICGQRRTAPFRGITAASPP